MRVMRVIARLNIGGPAIQAITLSRMLESRGYETTLVRGTEEPSEGNMDHLAQALGVEPVLVSSMRRSPGPRDLAAVITLARLIARERPAVVHTHAAKAGALGRVAALIAPGGRDRRLVHTYHGHSLTGYFGSFSERIFLRIERALARRTDRLVAVSQEVRNELTALGVGDAASFEVIPLGLDLTRFQAEPAVRDSRGAAARRALGIPAGARVVTLIARLVPIKRVDRFLRLGLALIEDPQTHLLIVGDGELGPSLRGSREARALEGRLTWAGFRHDIPDLLWASDVAVQTSDNEGTPVSLIEAQAAGVPVVSTRVGGVATVIRDGQTGCVVDTDDEQGLATAVTRLLADPDLRRRMADEGRRHAVETFSLERLVDDVDDLYRRLLGAGPTAAR